jgi:site-specific DNA recombinase
MKAAIYARVSTERQLAEGKTSMEDQLARCRAVCESRGWEIVEVYDEGDASAGTAHRAEFQRLLADA